MILSTAQILGVKFNMADLKPNIKPLPHTQAETTLTKKFLTDRQTK